MEVFSLKLIAEFDLFYVNIVPSLEMCVSKIAIICQTLMQGISSFMEKKASKTKIDELNTSKYYSIIVDSQLDDSHFNQLVFLAPFVLSEGIFIEKFLKFIL